jgi:hypothetical protein
MCEEVHFIYRLSSFVFQLKVKPHSQNPPRPAAAKFISRAAWRTLRILEERPLSGDAKKFRFSAPNFFLQKPENPCIKCRTYRPFNQRISALDRGPGRAFRTKKSAFTVRFRFH